VIDRHPLEIVVMHVVAVTVEDGLHHVNEEEHGDSRECKSDPISGETNVKETISLEGDKGVPQSSVGGLAREGSSLLLESLDVHIDSASHSGCEFFTLEHLYDLSLLLSNSRVARSDFLEVLVEVVFHLILLINNYTMVE
jgi:hypothetical protein